jgi:hypothetical protein
MSMAKWRWQINKFEQSNEKTVKNVVVFNYLKELDEYLQLVIE